jgi:hypothetical protein
MEGIETQASSSRKEIKFDLSESFEITTDNKIYELKISYNEQLMFFEIKEKNALLKDEFNLYTNLKELGDINRFFNQFETLKEVFDSLKTLITKKNVSIIQEGKKMKMKIINPINNKEFFINVNSKEKDTKSEINSIIACVNSLTQKVQNLENKLNELYVYKDDIEEIIKEKKEQKKKEKELYGQISKSSVINKDEIDLFMNWFDKKPTKIKLLLDSKIDGDSTQTFYNKCSNKFPTVVLVKTTKGRRFVGYCSIGWENTNGNPKKDINNFIFSLDKKKKYKIKKPEYGIYTSSDHFAFGGGFDFVIYNNCTSNNSSHNNNSGTYETTEQYELNGEYYFTVSSYEVYQIEY